jgi:hypothetical protein
VDGELMADRVDGRGLSIPVILLGTPLLVIDGQMARGLWSSPKHDFWPDTSTSPARFFQARAGTSPPSG